MSAALIRPERGVDTLRVTRWGGHRLAALRGGPAERGLSIGESWEFSTLPGRVSRARGRPLDALLGAPLPFLAKLIDTALPLSVQLHPDDTPSGPPGKEEAWIVLDAEPDARVWAGLRAGVAGERLAAQVLAGNDPRDLLEAHPVAAGTVILIPARTVHAIGPGILLAEIQQPSECTLRLYDYGSGRELHIDTGLATIDPGARPRVWRPGDLANAIEGRHVRLRILGPGEHDLDAAHPRLLVVARGEARLDDAHLRAGELGLLVDAARVSLAVGGLAVVGEVH